MSESNRGIIAATLLGIVSISLGTGAYFGALYGSHQQREYAVSSGQRSSDARNAPQQYDRDRAGLFGPTESIISNPDPSDGTEREKRDLAAQEATAVFAFWMVLAAIAQTVVAWVGIIYIRRTIRQGQESLDHARSVSAQELRPYLLFEPVKIEILNVGSPLRNMGWRLRFIVKNYGRSPARILSWTAGRDYVEAGFNDFSRVALKRHIRDGEVIPPEDTRDVWVDVSNVTLLVETGNDQQPLVAKTVMAMTKLIYCAITDDGKSTYVSERGCLADFTVNKAGKAMRGFVDDAPTFERIT